MIKPFTKWPIWDQSSRRISNHVLEWPNPIQYLTRAHSKVHHSKVVASTKKGRESPSRTQKEKAKARRLGFPTSISTGSGNHYAFDINQASVTSKIAGSFMHVPIRSQAAQLAEVSARRWNMHPRLTDKRSTWYHHRRSFHQHCKMFQCKQILFNHPCSLRIQNFLQLLHNWNRFRQDILSEFPAI